MELRVDSPFTRAERALGGRNAARFEQAVGAPDRTASHGSRSR